MVYGYARVSSIDQNLDRQLIQLHEYMADCLMSDRRISVNMFMLRKSVMKLFAPSRKAFL